jgi:8-oxo-dGTP pyrophosphatase MutT (NUDIX family)
VSFVSLWLISFSPFFFFNIYNPIARKGKRGMGRKGTTKLRVCEREEDIASMEWVMEVNEKNEVVGSVRRDIMRRENRIHRASFIYLFVDDDSKQPARLIIQKRIASKDYCPSYYGLATGGILQPDESYEENSRRELKEELGLDETSSSMKHVQWHWLGVDFYSDERCRVWGGIFLIRLRESPERELQLQKDEVESVRFLTISEIEQHLQANTLITPDSVYFYHTCLQRASILMSEWNLSSKDPCKSSLPS